LQQTDTKEGVFDDCLKPLLINSSEQPRLMTTQINDSGTAPEHLVKQLQQNLTCQKNISGRGHAVKEVQHFGIAKRPVGRIQANPILAYRFAIRGIPHFILLRNAR
jgi:hypothetical protein